MVDSIDCTRTAIQTAVVAGQVQTWTRSSAVLQGLIRYAITDQCPALLSV